MKRQSKEEKEKIKFAELLFCLIGHGYPSKEKLTKSEAELMSYAVLATIQIPSGIRRRLLQIARRTLSKRLEDNFGMCAGADQLLSRIAYEKEQGKLQNLVEEGRFLAAILRAELCSFEEAASHRAGHECCGRCKVKEKDKVLKDLRKKFDKHIGLDHKCCGRCKK